jgi:hypothetical protein
MTASRVSHDLSAKPSVVTTTPILAQLLLTTALTRLALAPLPPVLAQQVTALVPQALARQAQVLDLAQAAMALLSHP